MVRLSTDLHKKQVQLEVRLNVITTGEEQVRTLRLQDFLAEAGEDELDAEERGAVVFVEDGVDLDDFEGNHGLGVGNHFHGEMGFAVGDAAPDGSAHAGSIGGIDEIHIQADGNACRIVHGVLEGVGHDFAHAALINIAHGEDVDAGFLDDFAFLGVEVARTHNDDVAGLGLGLESEKVDEFGRSVTHDDGEGHAVDVAGRRRFGSVHVTVRVEPEVADLFFVFSEIIGDTGGYARGNRVVTAENEWEKAFGQGFFGSGGDITAGLGNFL